MSFDANCVYLKGFKDYYRNYGKYWEENFINFAVNLEKSKPMNQRKLDINNIKQITFKPTGTLIVFKDNTAIRITYNNNGKPMIKNSLMESVINTIFDTFPTSDVEVKLVDNLCNDI